MDDDFELEVTDLDTGEPIRHPLAHNAPAESGRGDDNEDNDNDDDSDELTLEPSRQGRPGRRNRLRTIMVSGVVLLAVALVIATNPAANSALYTVFRFPTPIPSPTPLPGGDIVYLGQAAPWSSVTIDGKKSAFASPGTTISWIQLARGRHTLAVTQPPFPALRCTISMPARLSDTCPLFSPNDSQGEQLGAGAGFPGGARFIDLGARFSLLPRDAQDALVAAVKAALTQPSARVTLSPGDHYLRDDGTLAVANTALQASFIPTLLLPTPEVSSDSSSCISFCDISGAALGGNATWNIMVSMIGSWHIATPDGQVVTESAPMYMSDPLYEGLSGSMQVTMSLLWTGRWQVSAQNGYGGVWSPTCLTAETMASATLGRDQVSILGMNAQDGRTAEQGCVVEITPGDPNASGPIDLLYRFGVLLAANDIAHRTFPSLPRASPAERTAAQRLLAQSYSP
ncbi:MAG TPA: hypothetical protein VFS83_09705 [Ktedonobacterales bacterium]|nr:hypothetical protein [Ktedonobacterales bacterium]